MSTIAIIGDEVSVNGFKMIGFKTYPVKVGDDLIEKIETILQQRISIIFITENFAETIQSEIEDYMDRFAVTIVRIPSKQGSAGTGLQRIKELCVKALGSDLLFQEKE